MDWGDQSLVPNIGDSARAMDDVKEFKYNQLEFGICIYKRIGEGTRTVCSTRPHSTEIKRLLFSDNLVLLYPTKEGLQQHLDILHRFCQTRALTVNLSKPKVMVF